jgi:hypothetical protein
VTPFVNFHFFKARDAVFHRRAEQGVATPCSPQYVKYFEKMKIVRQQKADL